jgi:starch synthase
MRIVFATAELSPVATVGGLAAAAAGLGAELRRRGVDVELVLPDYGNIALEQETSSTIAAPEWVGQATLRVGTHADVGRLHLISVPGIARSHPYLQPSGHGWADNTERFFRFSAAVAAYTNAHPPDVLHLNDWHTATALAAIDPAIPSVLSIHNLAYQGTTDGSWLKRLGPRAGHFEWWGDTNPLSGAIALADRVVAVSPNYAREITTMQGGFGLDEPLRARGEALVGILNGIDTDLWNPATDTYLASNFDAGTLEARDSNRTALLERLGFPIDDIPLATVVTRLTYQKGIDLLAPLVHLLAQVPVRLAVLGSGDVGLADHLRYLADTHPDSLRFIDGYDESLSHQLFAGGDMFLMPSRFEPCGLTQMQAMRYGAIPVVTGVGGLIDTVPDADERPRDGVGFVAERAEPADLLAATFRAARRVRDRRRRVALQRRMMAIEWSWAAPAADYHEMYRSLQKST